MYLRLAFAVAAHLRTEILLIDEVLAVGDASFQKKCIDKMSEVALEGRTVLFVSHNLGAMSQFCDSGMLLEAGRVAARGSIEEAVVAYGRLLKARNEAGETDGRAGIRVLAFELAAEGQALDSSAPLDFGLSLEVRKRYWSVLIYVVIATPEGSNIVVEVADAERFPSLLEPGRYRVEVQMPPLWLRPRGYMTGVKVLAHPADGITERFYSDWLDLAITGGSDVDGVQDRLLAPRTQWRVRALGVPEEGAAGGGEMEGGGHGSTPLLA
jgi:hypothetical protein